MLVVTGGYFVCSSMCVKSQSIRSLKCLSEPYNSSLGSYELGYVGNLRRMRRLDILSQSSKDEWVTIDLFIK